MATTVLLANPNAEVVRRDDRRWILCGTHRRELRSVIEDGADFQDVKAHHDSLPGEGTVIVLSARADEPTIGPTAGSRPPTKCSTVSIRAASPS